MRTTILLTIILIAGIHCSSARSILPDTAYHSVADIEYIVEQHDTSLAKITSYGDLYDNVEGVLTFRGSSRRDMPQSGTLAKRPAKVRTEWVFTTAYDKRQTSTGVWGGGSGWTGQPLYIEWSDSLMSLQRERSSALADSISSREIMVGSLSGEVYFIDFVSGRASRTPYNTGNPIKGTISLDPRLNGNLYIGQGIPAEEPFGAEVFNIFTHKRIDFFGRDSKSWRRWSAYDPSAVVVDGYVIRVSENGTLYKLIADERGVRVHSLMRYCRRGYPAAGIESSPAVWKNYLYFSDNSGIVLCVNINTMKPVWAFRSGDDSDATPIVLEESGVPMLYTATAVDKQGDSGFSYITKLNALTGARIWQQRVACHKIDYAGKQREGGMFATPLVGRGNCEDLLFTNICGMGEDTGTLVAIERSTGRIVRRTHLDYYSWSSPVALYTPNGEMYIFTGDVIGNVYLVEGSTGKIIFKKKMALNFESSPVVVDNCVVVGSRGDKIYKFVIE